MIYNAQSNCAQSASDCLFLL